MRLLLATVLVTVVATGCAKPPPVAPAAPASQVALLQQQIVQLTWLNASLRQALQGREAQLRQGQGASAPGEEVARLRALVAINDELVARLGETREALREALEKGELSDDERRSLALELERAQAGCGDDWARSEKLPALVDVLQRRLDAGLVHVRMNGDRAQLVVRPPIELVDDPWASR